MTKWRTAGVWLAVLAVTFPMTISRAAESHVFVQGSTYYPGDTNVLVSPPLVVKQGSDLILTNLDPIDDHTVTSFAFMPDELTRVFGSEPARFRESRLVEGVSGLAPGRYTFFCSLHVGMRGAIDVV